MSRIAGSLLCQRMYLSAVLLLSLLAVASAQQNTQSSQWKPVEDAMGRTAQVQADGTARFAMPRSNLAVMVDGFRIQPGFALGSWAAFRKYGNATMVTGDLVLLETEVPAVMSKLVEGGIEVSALHNHLLNETPSIMYMHIHGNGDAVALAKTLHDAVSLTSTPEPGTPAPGSPPQFDLDAQQIGKVLGYQGNVNGPVLQFSIPRSEKITEHGMEVPPSLGVATAINFQPTGNGRAAITGDFVLLASEVNPVIRTLRENSIVVTALHNHMLEENPRLFFMHFWAEGDPARLARGLRAALDKTASRR